ncbi:MAG: hypothetical protein Q8J70_09300 [Thiobacillus sp.]|nr:hypothetical protein [Thiobacillus sp.]
MSLTRAHGIAVAFRRFFSIVFPAKTSKSNTSRLGVRLIPGAVSIETALPLVQINYIYLQIGHVGFECRVDTTINKLFQKSCWKLRD